MNSRNVFALFMLIGYVAGSIPFSMIISKAFKLCNPMKEGSKNPGATNVMRISGIKYSIPVLILDILKGLLVLVFAKMNHVGEIGLGIIGCTVIIGHMFSVFLKFKGGKGVAVSFGVLMVLSPWISVFCLLIWSLILYLTRYVSVSSIIAAISMSVIAIFIGGKNSIYIPYFITISILVIYKHMENIARLISKTEEKI